MGPDFPVSRSMRRFMLSLFLAGSALGLALSVGFGLYQHASGGWDQSTTPFQLVVLFAGLSITTPLFGSSIRIMYQSLVLGERGQRTMESLDERLREAGETTKEASSAMAEAAAKVTKLCDSAERALGESDPDGLAGCLRDIRDYVRPPLSKMPDTETGVGAFRRLRERSKNGGASP